MHVTRARKGRTDLHEGVQVDLSRAQDGVLPTLLHLGHCKWIALVDLPKALHLFTQQAPAFTPQRAISLLPSMHAVRHCSCNISGKRQGNARTILGSSEGLSGSTAIFTTACVWNCSGRKMCTSSSRYSGTMVAVLVMVASSPSSRTQLPAGTSHHHSLRLAPQHSSSCDI